MMAAATRPDLLTSDDVARMCGVKRVTVARWVRSGRLAPDTPYNPYRRRQPPFRFHREDVERLAQPYQRAG